MLVSSSSLLAVGVIGFGAFKLAVVGVVAFAVAIEKSDLLSVVSSSLSIGLFPVTVLLRREQLFELEWVLDSSLDKSSTLAATSPAESGWRVDGLGEDGKEGNAALFSFSTPVSAESQPEGWYNIIHAKEIREVKN